MHGLKGTEVHLSAGRRACLDENSTKSRVRRCCSGRPDRCVYAVVWSSNRAERMPLPRQRRARRAHDFPGPFLGSTLYSSFSCSTQQTNFLSVVSLRTKGSPEQVSRGLSSSGYTLGTIEPCQYPGSSPVFQPKWRKCEMRDSLPVGGRVGQEDGIRHESNLECSS